MRKMFAEVTEQGTAMSETALCSECAPVQHELVDCTGNEYLECNWCGWNEIDGEVTLEELEREMLELLRRRRTRLPEASYDDVVRAIFADIARLHHEEPKKP